MKHTPATCGLCNAFLPVPPADGAWKCSRCGAKWEKPAPPSTPAKRHCDGCYSMRENVRDFTAIIDDGEPEPVQYCPECQELALVGWNGHTYILQPWSGF